MGTVNFFVSTYIEFSKCERTFLIMIKKREKKNMNKL